MALNKQEKQFLDTLKQLGITDEKSQATALAQIKGESNFIPREENLNYTPKRLLKIFPNKFKDEADATRVVGQGKRALAERIYGGRKDLGNTMPGDGYKYRGRGLIQLTGKDNYARIGKLIGEDLVNNPDLANDPQIAAKIAATFLVQRSPNLQDVAATTKAVGPANTDESIKNRTAYAEDYAQKIAKANEPPPPPDTSMPTFTVGGEFEGAIPAIVPGAEEQARIAQDNAARESYWAEEEGGAVGGIFGPDGNVVPSAQVMGTPDGVAQSMGFGLPATAGSTGGGSYNGPIPGVQAQREDFYAPTIQGGVGSVAPPRMPQANFGASFFSPALSRAPQNIPPGMFRNLGYTPGLANAISSVPANTLAQQYMYKKLFG